MASTDFQNGLVTGLAAKGIITAPIPTKTSELVNDSDFITHEDIKDKYDKTGGLIDGSIEVSDKIRLLAINDPEDHIGGVELNATEINNNFSTLEFKSFQTTDTTQYAKTQLKNIANPTEAYDAANKSYVDSKSKSVIQYMGILEDDGSITVSSQLNYTSVESNFSNGIKSEIQVYHQLSDQNLNHYFLLDTNEKYFNSKQIIFTGVENLGIDDIWFYKLILNEDNTYASERFSIKDFESNSNKKNSVFDNMSEEYYPSTKAVAEAFVKKPKTIWDCDVEGQGAVIYGQNTNLNAIKTWNIENLDLSEFTYIKCLINSGGDASARYTPPIEVTIRLDITPTSQTNNCYCGTQVGVNVNDSNVLLVCGLAVNSEKTAVAFYQEYSLYGTVAGGRNDNGRKLLKIIGYYD